MNTGFTGTKNGMTFAQGESLRILLPTLLKPGSEFHHGDCVGSDEQAARIAKGLGFVLVCHPPINNKHRAWTNFNDRMNPEYDYGVRDCHIVDDSNILIATPHTPYEIIRSGTWMTVRYARENAVRFL